MLQLNFVCARHVGVVMDSRKGRTRALGWAAALALLAATFMLAALGATIGRRQDELDTGGGGIQNPYDVGAVQYIGACPPPLLLPQTEKPMLRPLLNQTPCFP